MTPLPDIDGQIFSHGNGEGISAAKFARFAESGRKSLLVRQAQDKL